MLTTTGSTSRKIKPLNDTEKKVLELHNGGMTPQARIAETLGVDGATVSRALYHVERDFPDLLTRPRKKMSIKDMKRGEQKQEAPQKASGGLHLKSQAAAEGRRKPQEAAEQPQAVESKAEPEKSQQGPQEGPQGEKRKQVFSFRADTDDINRWKTFALVTGQSMEGMGAAAMNRYLESYQLTEEEQIAFNVLMRRKESNTWVR